MQIEAMFDAATSTFTYLVWDEATRDAVVIDPLLDFDPVAVAVSMASLDALVARVRALELRVAWALDTHPHADHLSGAHALRRALGCRIAIGSGITHVQRTFASILGVEDQVDADGSDWDRLLDDGATVDAGALRVDVLHTPGHTPACACYLIADALFVGDTLFMPDFGTGRCDFPGGSAERLFQSVQKLYRLPGETRVFVGHDYAPGGRALAHETTIAACRAQNIHVRDGTVEADFVAWRAARDRTLALPKLLYPSLQSNIRAGRLPDPDASGRRFFRAPLAGGGDLS
jgi:glyoxylase-like metal-dependent hydrolase (beta-lactamase superfamily II)